MLIHMVIKSVTNLGKAWPRTIGRRWCLALFALAVLPFPCLSVPLDNTESWLVGQPLSQVLKYNSRRLLTVTASSLESNLSSPPLAADWRVCRERPQMDLCFIFQLAILVSHCSSLPLLICNPLRHDDLTLAVSCRVSSIDTRVGQPRITYRFEGGFF